MKDKRRPEVFLTIAEILVELENSNKRLNKSKLYLAFNQKLKEKRGSGLAKRDYYGELKKLLHENKLQEVVDQSSRWRNKPIYITLTDEGRRQYNYNYLDIPTDPIKYRRKKLFQLLFLYEAAEYGRKLFKTDESFDRFLDSLSLSKNDLKPLKPIKDAYGSLYAFEPIKRIRIKKLYNENGSPIMYFVNLPGFTLDEILNYYRENIQKQQAALAARASWDSIEEHRASVYSPQSLGIFSYIQFSKREIQSAFRELQRAALIKPISLVNGATSRSAASTEEERYIIVDESLRNLVDIIWDLYNEKLLMLVTKHRLGKLGDNDRSWLVYMFGQENTNGILRGMEVNKQSVSGSKYKVDSYITRLEDQKERINFDERVYLVFRKYKKVLLEYGFQMDFIYRLLGHEGFMMNALI